MSKTRKSKQLWINCSQCQCILAVKDASLHDQNCPPTLHLQHGYIKNNVLNTLLEIQKTTGKTYEKNFKINLQKYLTKILQNYLKI